MTSPKIPNINLTDPYTHEQFLQWIEENKFDVLEYRSIRALFTPPAKTEQLSKLNLQALSQLTALDSYSCVLVIGNLKDNVEKTGIYLPNPNTPTYSTLFRDIQTTIPENIQQQLDALDKPIHYESIENIENSELDYSLPFIAEKLGNLPIIPLLYKKCNPITLFKIMTAFYNYKTLIIMVGHMSHSLSIDEVRSLDSSTISKIIALDDTVNSNQSNLFLALNSTIKLCDMKFLRPKVLSYQIVESNQTYVNKSGCASIVFYK